ncbi:hypothetical protein IMCC21906_03123 [Spongiibacter sp. IMCC21906]|uniref:hypothetical protein n=1 Tax=Spongiibacter sp. IMCC21906 TaxID=1620392 RepID=UPI00062DDFAA|nr:hypothetical protein [Spongiibacter sp. IMCC21906]AKH70763.1 hypothetical protein IMCC21906_03123 [Spongiibacter sp. IMCC21906]
MDINYIITLLQEYGPYLSIPIVSALVGYGTNLLAVKMMMYPVDFRGIGPLGWQGVVPGSAKKMSRILVEQSLGKVISQQEIIDRIDITKLTHAMEHRVNMLIHKIVDEVMEETQLWGKHSLSKFLWHSAPAGMKDAIYKRIQAQLPDIMDSITDDFRRDFEVIGNVNESVITRLETKKTLLIEIFLEAAGKEFDFLARSGFYFGFPLGIPVMFIWHYLPEWWVLPVFGLLVGYLTNKLALYMVQKPLLPKRIFGFTFQGLFIKRQVEISAYLGKVFSKELLNAETLAKDLLKEPKSVDKIQELVYESVSNAYLRFPNLVRPLLVASIGPDEYAKSKQIVTDIIVHEMQDPDPRYYEIIDESMEIETTLSERIGQLPPDEFFGLLHPVVAEDQWKLIAVGAVLGLAAGIMQWQFLV